MADGKGIFVGSGFIDMFGIDLIAIFIHNQCGGRLKLEFLRIKRLQGTVYSCSLRLGTGIGCQPGDLQGFFLRDSRHGRESTIQTAQQLEDFQW